MVGLIPELQGLIPELIPELQVLPPSNNPSLIATLKLENKMIRLSFYMLSFCQEHVLNFTLK